jgi:hypothetical protein
MRTSPASVVIAKALARPALWWCVSNLAVVAVFAQCTSPTQVPNQTISSGSPTFSDNNALAADSVVINNSASVTFFAGHCIELRPGFHATAGTAPTTFHAWIDTIPSALSVSPSSGTGLSQPFTWTVSSPAGYSNISTLYALFNTSISGVNACYIQYNRAANLLYLIDTAGGAWSSGIVPGTSSTTGTWNSYCTLNGIGSSVTSSGTQLSVTASVNFQTSFSGIKNNYLFAADNEGLNSGWQQMGTWTILVEQHGGNADHESLTRNLWDSSNDLPEYDNVGGQHSLYNRREHTQRKLWNCVFKPLHSQHHHYS